MGSTVQTGAGVPADPYPGKRVSSFPGATADRPGAGRTLRHAGFDRRGRPGHVVVLIVLLFLTFPAALAGQRPAELVGRVVDAAAAPIEGVHLELLETGEQTTTGPAGRYRFRAVAGGTYTLRAARIGYLTRTLSLELVGGATRTLSFTLEAAPVALEALTVEGRREGSGGIRLGRAEIEASGATSAGEIVERVPGVVVGSSSPGGPETVRIRGSASDAVLVLVDGVVINDPLTGEADLSQLSAAAIESVTVLPGARSARYGARAAAGVVLIETRRAAADRFVELSGGSLNTRGASAGYGISGPLDLSAGGAWRRIGGSYPYELPSEVGGGDRVRRNADAERWNLWLGAAASLAGGELRLRSTGSDTRRGLPGLGYLPSLEARQMARRVQGSVSWRRAGRGLSGSLSADGALHHTRIHDDAPPAGLPYDDTAAVLSWSLRGELERPRSPRGGRGLGWGVGAELRGQRIRSDQLTADTGVERLYAGAFVHGSGGVELAGGTGAVVVQLRTDRDPATDAWLMSRSATASWTRAGWAVHVANRSSFSPPTLSDQYFRDAVGVEPNPDLRAERVPSEWEVGVRSEGTVAGLGLSAGVTGYAGDVRDMIVWAPDFRFVWSPRNVDVHRRGVETRFAISAPAAPLRLDASHTYARTVYDRPGTPDTVQVIYRPRVTGSVRVEWRPGPWRFDVDGRYTGVRYPTPSPANALDGFWTLDAGAALDVAVGGWTLTPSVRADRLLDETASLIFGYPEPGRTWRLGLELRPETQPHP